MDDSKTLNLNVRKDFPILSKKILEKKDLIYFDTAASAQKPNTVINETNDFQLPPIEEGKQPSELEEYLSVLSEQIGVAGVLLTEYIDQEELYEHGKIAQVILKEGEDNIIPATIKRALIGGLGGGLIGGLGGGLIGGKTGAKIGGAAGLGLGALVGKLSGIKKDVKDIFGKK